MEFFAFARQAEWCIIKVPLGEAQRHGRIGLPKWGWVPLRVYALREKSMEEPKNLGEDS